MGRKRKHQPGCPCCKGQGGGDECGPLCTVCGETTRRLELTRATMTDDNGTWTLYPIGLGIWSAFDKPTGSYPHVIKVNASDPDPDKRCYDLGIGQVRYNYTVACNPTTGHLGATMTALPAFCGSCSGVFPYPGVAGLHPAEEGLFGGSLNSPASIATTCFTDRIETTYTWARVIRIGCNPTDFVSAPVASSKAVVYYETTVPPRICCLPCPMPERDLVLSWRNPLLGDGQTPLVREQSAFRRWNADCFFGGFNGSYQCGSTSPFLSDLLIRSYISGTCGNGQALSCSASGAFNTLRLDEVECSPLRLRYVVTAAGCPTLYANGFEWFEVTAP